MNTMKIRRKDIMKIIKSLEESGLLIKSVSKTVKNEIKNKKGGFLSMFLGTLGASLLGNLLTGKGKIRAVKSKLEQAKAQLEQVRIFNTASSSNKFSNTKVLSKET